MAFSKSSASRNGTEKPSSMTMRPWPPFVARLPCRTLRLPPQYLQVSIKLGASLCIEKKSLIAFNKSNFPNGLLLVRRALSAAGRCASVGRWSAGQSRSEAGGGKPAGWGALRDPWLIKERAEEVGLTSGSRRPAKVPRPGEFMLADHQYCYPLTITDFSSR